MRKTFIIASTGDRSDGLKSLLISLTPFFARGWKAVVVCQSYEKENLKEIKSILGNCGVIFNFKKMIGAHSAKVFALNNYSSNVWCSLDDDMLAIEKTDYDKISDILISNPNIGFISGNWARTKKQADAKMPVEELILQKLVYTGGGLLFRDDVANIIRNIPNEQYLFDDCLWSMYAYVNGYDNYRYKGSVAIHKICTVGGRKTWLKEQKNRVLPPEELLCARRSKDAEGYFICTDSDLTELAKELHRRNKKMRLL